MTSWLVDTLLYTGALIAVVLLLRRPVAREFGPKIAYALWALPALRLVLPPVVLPASMAPARPEANADILWSAAMVSDVPPEIIAAPEPGLEAADLLLPLWLAGAALFLAWRTSTYLRMRRELLAEARPVGEVGRIRLVETPAVGSPVAFGVFDKVIALPLRFMAMENRAARDLAIAHELEHHHGHDLLANFGAQPLLALHWFNPLAWLGWRAMRRDQEAACDARVLEDRGRDARVAYASVIASFAAGPRLALAAPMACPVLGEKSIIHRLRSLSMADVSPRRRLLGRILLAGGAITVPLTASVSYAAAEAQPLEEVELPPSVAAPPAPAAPAAPHAPHAPHPPEAPLAPEAPHASALSHEGDGRSIRVVHAADGDENRHRAATRHVRIDREVFREEQRAELEEMHKELEEMRAELIEKSEETRAHALALAEVHRNVPEIVERCDSGEPVRHTRLADGRQRITICERAIERQARAGVRHAREGLRHARLAIVTNTNLSPALRAEALAGIDEEIARLESER